MCFQHIFVCSVGILKEYIFILEFQIELESEDISTIDKARHITHKEYG